MSRSQSKAADSAVASIGGIATAHDVARLAGVSQSAVSRAFTQGASISSRMRRKVLNAATELGYRPNILARALITRRSKIVGLTMGNVENPLLPLVLDKLSTRLSEQGFRLLLFTAKINAQVDKQIEEFLRYRVDAIILLSTVMSSWLADECHKAGIPVILFNRTVKRLGGMCGVTSDNDRGGREIGRHLLEAGYKRFAFMAGYEDSSTSQMREHGFTECLMEARVPAPIRVIGDSTHAGAVRAARELLSLKKRPDAIFCANDQMACATVDVARYEFGLEPGKDVGIVGFDDIPMASWPSFSLTTYSQPIDEMAVKTVDFIDQLGKKAPHRQMVVPGKLIVRSSTR